MKCITLLIAGLFVCLSSLNAWPQEQYSGGKFPLPDESTGDMPTGVGILAIQAIQGTPGAEPIRNSKVTITLYHRNQIYDTIETYLDEHGVVVIDNLQLAMSLQPVVQIMHDDMKYQRIGTVMDAENPNQTIKVTCYEATDEQPLWTITTRHVMIDHADNGLFVREVIIIKNPANHTWLGTKINEDKRVTTSFIIPENAMNLKLGKGLHDWCCTDFSNGNLVNHLPLMPDTTEINFSYVVPLDNGEAKIGVAAPVMTERLMIVVPNEMTTNEIKGITPGGNEVIGERAVRYYTASNQQVGVVASITLAGGSAEIILASDELAIGPVRIIAAVGGGLFLLIAIAVVFVKSPKHIKTGRNQ